MNKIIKKDKSRSFKPSNLDKEESEGSPLFKRFRSLHQKQKGLDSYGFEESYKQEIIERKRAELGIPSSGSKSCKQKNSREDSNEPRLIPQEMDALEEQEIIERKRIELGIPSSSSISRLQQKQPQTPTKKPPIEFFDTEEIVDRNRKELGILSSRECQQKRQDLEKEEIRDRERQQKRQEEVAYNEYINNKLQQQTQFATDPDCYQIPKDTWIQVQSDIKKQS